MPGERHEQLEERQARDRVEERRDDAERLLDAADSGARAARAAKAIAKPIADRDQRQLEVLDERRLERVRTSAARTQSKQKRVVVE